jgi:hypothetical protein
MWCLAPGSYLVGQDSRLHRRGIRRLICQRRRRHSAGLCDRGPRRWRHALSWSPARDDATSAEFGAEGQSLRNASTIRARRSFSSRWCRPAQLSTCRRSSSRHTGSGRLHGAARICSIRSASINPEGGERPGAHCLRDFPCGSTAWRTHTSRLAETKSVKGRMDSSSPGDSCTSRQFVRRQSGASFPGSLAGQKGRPDPGAWRQTLFHRAFYRAEKLAAGRRLLLIGRLGAVAVGLVPGP